MLRTECKIKKLIEHPQRNDKRPQRHSSDYGEKKDSKYSQNQINGLIGLLERKKIQTKNY